MTARASAYSLQDEGLGLAKLNAEVLVKFVEEAVPFIGQSALVVLIGVIAYRIVTIMTSRLEREIEVDDPVVKRVREQRGRTIASLLNNIARVTIFVLTVLTVLGSIPDFNIGPWLAGLGVLGLALSFGAQSLVKDIINGIFVLIEGQYGIGDVIRVGETAGMVERITLRVTVLRDLHGVVHVIPNGEINTLSNLTKAWSRAVLDVRVAYKEDIDRVIDVLRDLGQEIANDPEWSQLLTEPPAVLGVENFAESGVIVRMIATTLPLKQWEVAREMRRRIKNRFDAEGIVIPYPHLTFYWGDGQLPPALGTAPADFGSFGP